MLFGISDVETMSVSTRKDIETIVSYFKEM
jgi:hypothetical protein